MDDKNGKNGKVKFNGTAKEIIACLTDIKDELKSTNARISKTNKRISLLDSNVSELIGFEDRIKIIVADHEEILIKRIIEYDTRDRERQEQILSVRTEIQEDVDIAKQAIQKFENFKEESRTQLNKVDEHLKKAGKCIELYEGLVCVKGAKTEKKDLADANV